MSDRTAEPAPEIRKLWKGDVPELKQHLLRLDTMTRYSRFGALVSDDFVANYAEGAIAADKLVFGVFFDGHIRAIGELMGLFKSWPNDAEFALSVEAEWQNRGIGTMLFARLVTASQNRGVKSLQGLFFHENDKMQRIVARHHPQISRNSGQIEARFDPPWASPMSFARELAQDAASYFRRVHHPMA
ncbi:GNAT family N-acetyltransferase [Roseovarius dicentrarchi]|uniref:GNAT family N-acetyltransferase n=1 Tax=Roseovarius dicentrarchi TaxID=2250573 RepID=UPI000DEA6CAC|nr:GNAT family N-acetyltransferase [Roseovarius dicentrarchi]